MSALLCKSRFVFVFGLFLLVTAVTAEARSLPDFVGLVKQNSPAVVNISTTQHKTASSKFRHNFRIPDLPEDSPFNEFFERFFGEGHGGGGPEMPKEFDAQSLGSGFIISEDGYILTAAHVVEGADEVVVHLSDRREFVAEVVGSDKRSDVALLKIDADKLPKVVDIGSTENLEVGEWVLAIGSPFGFGHSATAGIVSAKGRSLPSENYVPFIQTDVAINPGNSGGPLFDLDGKVVGINSQIYSRTGGFMGLSFAIPIEMAMNVSEQLRTKGRVTRGWLGVMIQDVTRELADSFGMRHPTGALVARVLPDSPAQAGGLQTGDIILQYNGNKIARSSMLPPLVGASNIERPAKLEILRNGKKRTLEIRIGELPGEDEIARAAVTPKSASQDLLGLGLADLTPGILKQLGQEESTTGVLVEEVMPGPAQVAGIEEGDIIQMINNTQVTSVAEFSAQLEKLPKGKNTAVLVLRSGGPIFLALSVPRD
jgi:serine protease Do